MRLTRYVVVLWLLLGGVAGAAPPDDDPFYGVPPGIEGLANGTVIDARKVTATLFSIPMAADAWQVRFKTQDNTGAHTAYITTVLVPRIAWAGSGPRPVLSYQTPEDGVGLKCAPSYMLTAGLAAPGNTTPDAQTIQSALDRGWSVVVPDYEGPRSMWLGADGQARGVIDSLRAARAFAPAGIDPDAPIALWGYSGGAIASVTAAQLQPAYAPDLALAGVALGGNNASIRGGFEAFDGSLFGGAVVIGFIGLDRSYPDLRLSEMLNDAGRAAVARSQQDCIADAVIKHPLFRAEAALKDPAALNGPVFEEVFRRSSPLTFPGVPAAPVYDYHAISDQLAPIGPNRELLERFCREGVTVESVEDPGDHFTEVPLGEPGAFAFLAERFAGDPPADTCGERPAPSPAACAGAPRVRITAARIARRRLSVRGTASAPCGVSEVTAAIARRRAGRCRFVGGSGRLGRPRRCSRPVFRRARGTTRWMLPRTRRLPAGRYVIRAWAADGSGRRGHASRSVRRLERAST